MGFESDKDLKQLLEHGCLFDKKISIFHQMASDLRPLAFNCCVQAVERKRSQVGRHLMKNGGRLVTNPKGDSFRGKLNLFSHQIGIHAQAIVPS